MPYPQLPSSETLREALRPTKRLLIGFLLFALGLCLYHAFQWLKGAV